MNERVIIDSFERYARNPAAFFRQQLGFEKMWKKQVEIAEAVRDYKYVAVPSGHGGGKTVVASAISWWFKLCFRPSKVITTAVGGRNVKEQLAAEISARYRALKAKYTPEELAFLQLDHEPGTERWEMTDEEFMLWFATKSDEATEHATRVAGHHSKYVLFIFDEAGAIKKPIWTGIQGSLLQENRKLLAIGNPSDPNSEFARFCKRSDVKVIRMNILEHPNYVQRKTIIPGGPSYAGVEELRREVGDGSGAWKFKVLGIFPDEAFDSLISFAIVQAAFDKKTKECVHSTNCVCIGVDVARQGDDLTVVWAMCSCGAVLAVEPRRGQDLMATVGLIIEVAENIGMTKKEARRIAIDDTGIGGGVTDRLRELGWNVCAVNFGEKPADEKAGERYANVRSELWNRGKDYLRGYAERGRLPPAAAVSGLPSELQDKLRDELTAVRYKQTSDQRIILEPKEKVKQRLGRSPDYADALMLCLYVMPGNASPSASKGRNDPSKTDPYWEKDFGKKREDDGITPGKRSYDVAAELVDW